MSITLTEGAAAQVKSILEANSLDATSHVVRVGVTVNPDNESFDYELDIVDDTVEADRRFESHGLTVVCDPRSYLWLNGAEVDFSEGDGGFQFHNPLEP